MKRCPQCSFLYLDTDEVCDLDGTALTQVNDADVEGSAAKVPAAVSTSGRKGLVFTAVGGLLLGVVIVFGYLATSRRGVPEVPSPPPVAQTASPSPTQPLTIDSPTPTPEASPSPAERSSPSPTPRTTRVGTSNNPVSTTANDKSSGAVVIRLTSGASIEADEAWRTNQGVWYRRSGVVTLLNGGSVRSIERRK